MKHLRTIEEEYGIYNDSIIDMRKSIIQKVQNYLDILGLKGIKTTKNPDICVFYTETSNNMYSNLNKIEIPTVKMLKYLKQCATSEDLNKKFSIQTNEEEIENFLNKKRLINNENIEYNIKTYKKLLDNNKFYRITSRHPREIERVCKKGTILQYIVPASNIEEGQLEEFKTTNEDILDLCKPLTFIEIIEKDGKYTPLEHYYGVKPSNFDKLNSSIFQ